MKKTFIIIIILAVSVLILYFVFIKQKIEPGVEITPEFSPEPEQEEINKEVEMLETLSESDDVNLIESELNSSDFSNLDKELSDIEKELGL